MSVKNIGVYPVDTIIQDPTHKQPMRAGIKTGDSKRVYWYRALAVTLLRAEACPPQNSNLEILTTAPQNVV